jgi:hypothetical protein
MLREESERIGSGDEQVRHVVRLIEQHAGIAPRQLLGAPVRPFRFDREFKGGVLRVFEHRDCAAGALYRGFEIVRGCHEVL